MKILVTGSAGFIGFHLIKALVENKENSVVGIDNINDYYDVNLEYGRLSECGIKKEDIIENQIIHSTFYCNYDFGKIDLTDFIQLGVLFKKYQFDYVINLAAQAGVRYSLENPHAYINSNISGFVNILECCRYNNIKHLIYASSSSVYGLNNKIPFKESAIVDKPASFYAATKRSNELMAHSYSHLFNLPSTGVRLFTVYGAWGRPDMAPMIFARSIREGRTIKVFNNGDMLRDFTFINDVIKSIVLLLDKIPDKNSDSAFYQIFNIGNSKPINLLQFIKTIEYEMQKDAHLEMYPFQSGDVKETYADITKLTRYINYKPQTLLPEGIKSFIEWFNSMEQ